MSNDAHIESIIKDCVAADPALAGREGELRPIVKALLEAKPDTRFDADFAKRLREQVMAEASTARTDAHAESLYDKLMKRNPFFILIPGGAALGVLLAVVLSYQSVGTPRTSQVATESSPFVPASGVTVAMVGDGAFGAIGMSGESISARPQSGGGGPLGLGGGGGMPTASAPAPAADMAVREDAAKMMIAPDYVTYRYVFAGDLPALESSMPVYRRVKGFGGGSDALSALRPLAGGLIDLGPLQSAKVQSFSVMEDREFGYAVYVDAVEGAISLSQNWLKWPHPENLCREESCWKQYQMNASQLPSDEAIIAIADRFLADYAVSRDAYGTPEVRREWQPQIAAGADASSVIVPDSIAVVYPLMIDGERVEDESGNVQGLTVNVNVRHSRVDGLWGLNSNAYEASQYAVETDAKRILSFVERGGLWGWYDPNAKAVDVQLGAPEVTLTRSWTTRPDGTGEEILVPALRFPVLNPPADQQWFRKAVVIPITKQTLDAVQQPGEVGIMPVPQPLMVK